jgi:hypothetical protein
MRRCVTAFGLNQINNELHTLIEHKFVRRCGGIPSIALGTVRSWQLPRSTSSVPIHGEHKTLPSKFQRKFFEFPEIRCPETCHRVPPCRRLTTYSKAIRLPDPKSLTVNPGVPHPGAFPLVISLNPSPFNAYMRGLRKPRAGLPAAIRASFSRATKPATDGVDAEVPPMGTALPPTKTRKKSACAEMSGIAFQRRVQNGTLIGKWWAHTRPKGLKSPA